jgi:hypothetical protein
MLEIKLQQQKISEKKYFAYKQNCAGKTHAFAGSALDRGNWPSDHSSS